MLDPALLLLDCHSLPPPQGSQAPLGDFDQMVEGPWPVSTFCSPWGPPGAGKCILAGESVEIPPVSASTSRSAGRRPFHKFRYFGPSAREFRPVDALASPAPPPLPLCWALPCHGVAAHMHDIQISSTDQLDRTTAISGRSPLGHDALWMACAIAGAWQAQSTPIFCKLEP
jgi:hypothetical protein